LQIDLGDGVGTGRSCLINIEHTLPRVRGMPRLTRSGGIEGDLGRRIEILNYLEMAVANFRGGFWKFNSKYNREGAKDAKEIIFSHGLGPMNTDQRSC
jgi:hypothetical protein